jgi:hypothetical protein
MKMLDEEQQSLCARLESQNNGLWKEIQAQIHYNGKEAWFWFLVDGPEHVKPTIDVFLEVSKLDIARFGETEFIVGLYEKTKTQEIMWENFEDVELRAGKIIRPVCGDPIYRELPKKDVFRTR